MRRIGTFHTDAHLPQPACCAVIVGLIFMLSACDRSFVHADPNAANKLATVDINDIVKSQELQHTAMELGTKVYSAACASCHGTDLTAIRVRNAEGLSGEEKIEILDGRHLLHGSSPQSVQEAITSDQHVDSAPFGQQLTPGEIKAVSVYVSEFIKHDWQRKPQQ